MSDRFFQVMLELGAVCFLFVCVCVCERERERVCERESVCVRERERVCVCVYVCVRETENSLVLMALCSYWLPSVPLQLVLQSARIGLACVVSGRSVGIGWCASFLAVPACANHFPILRSSTVLR